MLFCAGIPGSVSISDTVRGIKRQTNVAGLPTTKVLRLGWKFRRITSPGFARRTGGGVSTRMCEVLADGQGNDNTTLSKHLI